MALIQSLKGVSEGSLGGVLEMNMIAESFLMNSPSPWQT